MKAWVAAVTAGAMAFGFDPDMMRDTIRRFSGYPVADGGSRLVVCLISR